MPSASQDCLILSHIPELIIHTLQKPSTSPLDLMSSINVTAHIPCKATVLGIVESAGCSLGSCAESVLLDKFAHLKTGLNKAKFY